MRAGGQDGEPSPGRSHQEPSLQRRRAGAGVRERAAGTGSSPQPPLGDIGAQGPLAGEVGTHCSLNNNNSSNSNAPCLSMP